MYWQVDTNIFKNTILIASKKIKYLGVNVIKCI